MKHIDWPTAGKPGNIGRAGDKLIREMMAAQAADAEQKKAAEQKKDAEKNQKKINREGLENKRHEILDEINSGESWVAKSLRSAIGRAKKPEVWSLLSARCRQKPCDLVISKKAAQKIDEELIPLVEASGYPIWLDSAPIKIANMAGEKIDIDGGRQFRLRHLAIFAEPARPERCDISGDLQAFLATCPRAKYARFIVATTGPRVGIEKLDQAYDIAHQRMRRLTRELQEKMGTDVIFSSLETAIKITDDAGNEVSLDSEKRRGSYHIHYNLLIIQPLLSEIQRTAYYAKMEKIMKAKVQNCGLINGTQSVRKNSDGETYIDFHGGGERDAEKSNMSYAISYVVKYLCKGDELAKLPSHEIKKFCEIIEKKRRFSRYGDFATWSRLMHNSPIEYRSIGPAMIPVLRATREPRSEDAIPDGDNSNYIMAAGFRFDRELASVVATCQLLNFDPLATGERSAERMRFAQWWCSLGGELWQNCYDAGKKPRKPWYFYQESIQPKSSTYTQHLREGAPRHAGKPYQIDDHQEVLPSVVDDPDPF